MHHIFDVAHTLVQHVKANCPEDIALIAYYGSYAQGTATKRSDLDFFFIPAAPSGYRESIQFVLNDISFDFWPISWERAERMAAFDQPLTTIIANCEILYVRSEGDRARLLELREKIIHTSEQGLEMTEKAEAQLRDVYVHLYKMSKLVDSGDSTLFRTEAYGALTTLLESLALLNRTYFTRGWGKNKEQMMQLPLKPDHLEELMQQIMISQIPAEIQKACEQLTQDTLELVLKQKETHSKGAAYPTRMAGFYEEIKGVLDKIRTACENKDYDAAFFSAVGVQDEIARFLYYAEHGYWPNLSLSYQNFYSQLGFPNIISLLDPHRFEPLEEAVEQLDQLMQKHLTTKGVAIRRFASIAQLERFLANRQVETNE
jgi:predicted nucleotidyltransferase